ncbi:MAG: hypothetical protein ABIZ09_16875 [Rhodoferax sp.]|jgi:hypothetical protein
METTGLLPLIWWALGGTAVLGCCVYAYMEYQAYLLRTSVISVPGGLRFVAQGLTVESRHASKEIKVITRNGRYARQPLAGGDEEVQSGSLTVTLAAIGLKIEVSRISVKDAKDGAAKATGMSRIVFAATDEPMQKALGRAGGDRSELRIDSVPDAIAVNFQQFANGLRAWIDKVEQQLATQVAEQRKREQEAAVAAAGLVVEPEEDATIPLSEADREARATAQLDKWRAAAGFKGSSTEMHYDDRGQMVWLIDLDPTGKVILHANKRTFSGSLKGATVNGFGTELEVAVRDDFWSEDDPHLVAFRILTGSRPESRRAWKERLDQLIHSFAGSAGQQQP